MRKITLLIVSLIFVTWSYCQQVRVDSVVVKLPFTTQRYGWPFDSIKVESNSDFFHLFSDTINHSILCVQTDRKGCMTAVGIYNLTFNDSNVVSLSRQKPYPPYEKVTIYVQIVEPYKEGIWIYFSDGVFRKRETYSKGILLNKQ